MLCHVNCKGLFKETLFFCCFLHLWEITFKSKFLSDNAVYMDIVDVANIFKILLFFVDKYGMFLYLVTEETNRTTYVYISALVKDRCPSPIVLELFFSALACSEKLTVVFGEGAQYGSCENTFAVSPVLQGVSQSMACSVYMQGVHLTNAGMQGCESRRQTFSSISRPRFREI